MPERHGLVKVMCTFLIITLCTELCQVYKKHTMIILKRTEGKQTYIVICYHENAIYV